MDFGEGFVIFSVLIIILKIWVKYSENWIMAMV